MKITKQKIIEIIKEEVDRLLKVNENALQKASSIGGADVKKFLKQTQVIDKLAAQVAEKVGTLTPTQKAVVAAAILLKMGYTADDMDTLKLIIPQIMAAEAEAKAEAGAEKPEEA